MRNLEEIRWTGFFCDVGSLILEINETIFWKVIKALEEET